MIFNVIDAPRTFATKRLSLRRVSSSDAQAIMAAYATDPEVTRYLTWAPYAPGQDGRLREFLTAQSRAWNEGREFAWVIALSPDGDAIGSISARVADHRLEIGYVLARVHWGQGFMPEVAGVVAEWAASLPSVFRVWATCDVDNLASARVLEKAGFEREGRLHNWIVHPNIGPEPRDCYVYAYAA